MKKILILAANPTDTNKLRLDEEVREIETVHRQAKYREEIEIISKWAIRVDDLRSALLYYKPNIVHFSGHGKGDDGLVLENQYGQKQFVSSESLGGLFKLFESDIECVVLNACYSEVQAEVIQQHINCVVGMNKQIGDKAAIKFATGFYEALANGRNYQDSFNFGCNAIDLQGSTELQTPQIKIRDSSKSLLGEAKFNAPVPCDKLTLVQRLKKESLEKRLAVLEENYQALERDYTGAGDADEKNRLQSKLDRKIEEIDKITKELSQINYGE
ncbi:CHAT domain-containing protein [Brunnivagina elsteri]|uniref:CHAT domain-containing protein n=1 Tax=Brunnivagina elsteri CCALA 953 TaxID=987040 RepID=A0A2A2TNW8_9CYAN|nr:CHAT domain-containing protein [Calothrix elsteri]PAX60143.1 CHAT domain-containing protein [Calothrix elsteri CCALA 953]